MGKNQTTCLLDNKLNLINEKPIDLEQPIPKPLKALVGIMYLKCMLSEDLHSVLLDQE